MKFIDEVYAPKADITFLMEEVRDENGELVSTECVGWYYGEPDEDATKTFRGKLKAEYI